MNRAIACKLLLPSVTTVPAKQHSVAVITSSHSINNSFSTTARKRTGSRHPRNMDSRTKVPYLAQDAEETQRLVSSLKLASQKGKAKAGFVVRKKVYELSDTDHRTVDSWSMNDYEYKKDVLPTYARGIFTHSNNNGKAEIAIRGYDKFFNVGEVKKTQWRNIEDNTRGPYELSVKENGCIIFIGGLDDETLIITSKHSTGPRQDNSANHAGAGEVWIDRQLQTIGKTRGDLAKTLRRMNATAVAELCDDSFEEHVLEYTPEQAGLYLHGINLNLPEFATYPGNLVHKFADEWGFKKAQYVMMETIEDVKPFLDKTAETGNYDGRDTEGFVIRCQARDSEKAPWLDWFFKYKFEEPYLMYRQWREVTKAILAGKLPKYNKHKQITEEYINYARRQLAKDPQLGKAFNANHGIIAMRDGFLAEKGLKGHEIIRSEEQNEEESGSGGVTHGVVLIPIASIGCGKTTVATALTRLFGWGHEQNDNIEGKGRPKRFAIAITNLMAAHPVVIADRNNHQRRERAQIIDDVQGVVPDAIFVAMHYVHDRDKYTDIRRATQERVMARGDKHQTIQAASKGQGEIVGIMDGFLSRFEPVNVERPPDNKFDQVIDLDVMATSRENLATVVNQLHDWFPKLFELPSDEAMDEAISHALNEYNPELRHDLGKGSSWKENKNKSRQVSATPNSGQNGGPAREIKKEPRIEFFGIYLPTSRINSILDAVFADVDAETGRFYKQLKAMKRVQQTFHVTLMHRSSEPQHPEYWRKLTEIFTERSANVPRSALTGGTNGGIEIGKASVQLERVVWSNRLLSVLCRIPDRDFPTVNAAAHITIGTADAKIPPRESNDLLQAWMKGHAKDTKDLLIKGNVQIDGDVRAMLSR